MNSTLVRFATFAVIFLLLQGCVSTGAVVTETDAAAPGTSAANATVVPTIMGPPPALGPAEAMRISPGDLIQLQVFQAPEMSSKERVMTNGQIFLPLIGAVKVAGLTTEEAEQLIARKLGENYLQNPQVNLFVEESASQKVTVLGDVGAPGVFPLKGQMSLMEAIALARGTKSTAKDDVVIFRGAGTQNVKAYVVDLEAVQAGTIANPLLAGGDTIHVAQSGTAVFFDKLLGYVRLGAIPVGM